MNIKQTINSSNFLLALAPMDGVLDHHMRDILTKNPGINLCVTEFLRVTNSVYPEKVFTEIYPEIHNNCKTQHGTPTVLQILGSDPDMICENALKAVHLGAVAIDMNFGCPAKVVNNHNGGAALLKTPELIGKIILSLKKRLPPHVSVSAKMRLGFENPEDCISVAQVISDSGADWLTVHCRTKMNGYAPPAYWEWIPKIKKVTSIPIIVNGDIFSVSDFLRCQNITEENRFMIGRGALANPFLFYDIQNRVQNKNLSDINALQILELILYFFKKTNEKESQQYSITRTKQWLKYLTKSKDFALVFDSIFNDLKVITHFEEFRDKIYKHHHELKTK